MKRARVESYADEFAQLVEEDRQAERDAQDVVEMERVMALRDSNETRSKLNASAASAAEAFNEDHREVDHMIALMQEEDDANDMPPGPAPAAAPPGPQQGPPLGPVPAAAQLPQEPPRGFQPDVDVFDGEVDTDDDEADGGVAPMAVDSYDDLLNPDKHRIGPAYGTHGYARPEAPPITPSEEDFVFMQTECTYAIDPHRMIPILRVWGLTERGNSVLYEDDTFAAYFYAAITRHSEAEAVRAKLDAYLATQYNTRQKNGRVAGGKFVVSMVRCEGRSICGYVPDEEAMTPMYKFVMAHPAHVAAARNSLEYTNRAVTERPIKTFEANVPYELRWLIDKRINGCQWIRLRRGTYTRTGAHSTAQYVLRVVPAQAGTTHSAEPIELSEKGTVAPLRVLSYDIEVLKKGRGFPTADTDPVIMISCALAIIGVGIVHRVVFATRPPGKNYVPLQTESGEDDAELFVYNTEEAMLLAWSEYVVACDPEALTGWNTNSFDMPYICQRAIQCKIQERFMRFSRINDKAVWLRKSTTQSKAHGARDMTELLCEGRIDFDMMLYVLKMVYEKFRSYTLNYVSHKLLGEQKIDLNFTFIPVYYESDDDEDRTHLARYCMRDALLPLRLMDKLMAIINCVEQARVTGVPIKWIISRGQGIKTFSNILRYKEPWQHTPSRSPKSNSAITAGGHVEDPVRGYYVTPIASLDFSSLYPSAMIAGNVCYSTKVSLAWARAHLQPSDYNIPYPSVDKKTPEEIEREKLSRRVKSKKERDRDELEQSVAGLEPDFCFVKRHIRQGVLPRLLETLLATRVNVKNMMKQPAAKADQMLMFVLDGRQLAIKVCANSVYGFLKAFILTDKDLMCAVTSYGRNMLRIVKETIRVNFNNVRIVDVPRCRELGIDAEVEPAAGVEDVRPYTTTGAFIVYGDTDSTMCALGNAETNTPADVTLADCAKYGAQMAAMCTARFEKPNSLVFEAVKLRALYINKKRYAALQIEKYIPGERMAAAMARADVAVKGLEGKRRDNAAVGSDTQNAIVDILLLEGDVSKAEQYVRNVLTELLENRVDFSRLIITKALSKTDEQYALGGTKQPHVELKKRIEKRAHLTGEIPPVTGERVPYVMVSGPAKKTGKGSSKTSELAESPVYAQKTGAPIDFDWYSSRQVWPAVARVMTCIYEPDRCEDVDSSMTERERESLQVYNKLFAKSLPHMNHRVEAKSRSYGITAFTQSMPRCLTCKSLLKRKNQAVCAHCDSATAQATAQAEYERRKEARDAAHKKCLECQNGKEKHIKACAATTCGNFFHRDRVVIELSDIEDIMGRFKK